MPGAIINAEAASMIWLSSIRGQRSITIAGLAERFILLLGAPAGKSPVSREVFWDWLQGHSWNQHSSYAAGPEVSLSDIPSTQLCGVPAKNVLKKENKYEANQCYAPLLTGMKKYVMDAVEYMDFIKR